MSQIRGTKVSSVGRTSARSVAITLGSVSTTMGCNWLTGALVCSGTDTAPTETNATSTVA
jgi:hypothetical protein